MTKLVKNYIIAFTIILIGIFLLAHIRPWDDWSGDYAQYIRHAINIANGISYGQLGYIFNPQTPAWPQTYPPVFPFLLAPVYKIFGMNTLLMKVEINIFFLVFLLIFVSLIRQRLSFPSLLALLLVLSLNPFIAYFKDSILSDIPFLLFTYLTMLLIHRFYERNKSATVFSGLFLGVSMYLSYGTRSIGIVLLPALLAYEFINQRRISSRTFIAIGIFLLLAVIQEAFFHNDRAYLHVAQHFDIHSLPQTFRNDLHALFSIWGNSRHHILQLLLTYSMLFLALSGFMVQVTRRISIIEIFFAIYWPSVLILPTTMYMSTGEGLRYFLPVLPLYMFYIFCGAEFWIMKPVGTFFSFLRATGFIGLFCLVVLSYGLFYRHWDYRVIDEGPNTKESREFFDFVRNNTTSDAIFIFRKPPILALYTGRKASNCVYSSNLEDLWKYIHEINAQYFVYTETLPDKKYLSSFIAQYQSHLKRVFMNKDFQVFKIVE
jgi:hypothetical protein